MKKRESIYEDKKILNDRKFILWCLNPTKELDRYWQKWIEEKPEQARHIEEMKKIICSIRLNDDKMPDNEYQQLQARILHDIRK